MSEEKISKKVSIWAYVLIGAAGLGILMFDVPTLWQPGGQAVAKVGEREITLAQLNEATSTWQSRLPDMPAKTLQDQALHQLIQQALLEEHALGSGFSYPDEFLHKQIEAEFATNEAYQSWLRERGISAMSFQESLRKNGTITSYYQTLFAAAPNDDALATAQLNDMAQTQDYTAVRLPLAPAAAGIAIDDAAVKAWYDAHPEAFMTPEEVSVRFIVLDRARLADAQEISAEALAAQQRQNERRAGQYLIFDDRSAADAALAALNAGEKTFADLAAEIQSGAIGGEAGDLPLQQHGKGVDPVADDALFALEKTGDVSPVLTSENFNAMILTLTERQESSGDDARAQLAQNAAEARYSELAAKAFDAALAEKPLSQIAEIIGEPIETADNLTAQSALDWLANAKIQLTLFGEHGLDVGKIAEPVELDAGRSIFYEITARKAPELRPFADVQNDAQSAWRMFEAGKMLDERSAEIAQAWRDGGDVDALIAQYGGERQPYRGINPLMPSEGVSPEVAAELMRQNEAVTTAVAENGDRLITHLDAVHPGDASQLPEEMQQLLRQQQQASSRQETENAMAQWLEQNGDVKIYEARLPQP